MFLLPASPVIWGLAMAASFIVGLKLVWPRSMDRYLSVMLVGALLGWLPVAMSLYWANVNSLVVLMLALALRFPKHAGWAIGLASAAKLLPLLMLPWLVRRCGLRAGVIAVTVFALAMLIVVGLEGPSVVLDFVRVRASQSAPPHPIRWGLVPLGVPDGVVYAVAGVLAIIAGALRSFTLGVAAMLVATPVPHAHYYAWALVPTLALSGQAFKRLAFNLGRDRQRG